MDEKLKFWGKKLDLTFITEFWRNVSKKQNPDKTSLSISNQQKRASLNICMFCSPLIKIRWCFKSAQIEFYVKIIQDETKTWLFLQRGEESFSRESLGKKYWECNVCTEDTRKFYDIIKTVLSDIPESFPSSSETLRDTFWNPALRPQRN